MANATQKKAPKGAKPKTKPWISHPLESYQSILPELAHFSAKMVNSNTPAFGVRLTKEMWRNDLPYVAVSTTHDVIRLTYLGDAGRKGLADIEEQMYALQSQDFSRYTGGKPDADALRDPLSALPVLDTSYVTDDHVGVRLRQVIVHDDQSHEDIVLTPLHAAGLNAVIRARQWAEYSEKDPDDTRNPPRPLYRKRANAYLQYGGSNPQNIGVSALVEAQRHPLWFTVPNNQKAARKALAFYYYGVKVRFSGHAVHTYGAWRARVIAEGRWSHMGVRQEDRAQFLAIIAPILTDFYEARDLIARYRDFLSLPDSFGDGVEGWQQPLLDSSLQKGLWRREAAAKIMALLFEYGQQQDPQNLGHTRMDISVQEHATRTGWVEEVLV